MPNRPAHSAAQSIAYLAARHDRFQGALLGLWLAPQAVALSRAAAGSGETALQITNAMAESVALGCMHIRHYIARPLADLRAGFGDTFYQVGSHRPNLPCWLVSVPALLRYHDSWMRRYQWLASQSEALRILAECSDVPFQVATAEILLLGDLLEIVMCDRPSSLLDRVDELHERAHRISLSASSRAVLSPDIVPDQGLYYRDMWDDLFYRYRARYRAFSTLAVGPEEFSPRAFGSTLAGSALTAFSYPESYVMAVQMTIQTMMQLPMQQGETALVAGLVAGALQGGASLPAAWQLHLLRPKSLAVIGSSRVNASGTEASDMKARLTRSDIVEIARQLYSQWAGMKERTNG